MYVNSNTDRCISLNHTASPLQAFWVFKPGSYNYITTHGQYPTSYMYIDNVLARKLRGQNLFGSYKCQPQWVMLNKHVVFSLVY